MTKNILVFPCGSEVALEVFRSLQYSRHFNLIGGSSTDDHGAFVFKKHIKNLPYIDDPLFEKSLRHVITTNRIDAIYPAMDSVIKILSSFKHDLGIPIITSSPFAALICASKMQTYRLFADKLPIPVFSSSLDSIYNYPIFIKPDQGYGTRNTFLANNYRDACHFVQKKPDIEFVYCEYLPGLEWTIDCFSDQKNKVLFSHPRLRSRISNGISVRTSPCLEMKTFFDDWVTIINDVLKPTGAWFFQAKQDINGEPKLLEIAVRISGSSGIFRCMGVNLALLSCHIAFNDAISIHTNDYLITQDRALNSLYKLNLSFSNVYVDFDDCLHFNGLINHKLVSFIFSEINRGSKIYLITRHKGDLMHELEKLKIRNLFDEIIHIKDDKALKSNFIVKEHSIFIDDSFRERLDVSQRLHLPVFSPEMIECLFRD